MSFGLASVDPVIIAQKVIAGFRNRMTTTELDEEAAEQAIYLTLQVNKDFSFLFTLLPGFTKQKKKKKFGNSILIMPH